MFTRTMPNGVMKDFLKTCQTIDAWTDQMARSNDKTNAMKQISRLRAKRDAIASRHPWTMKK